MCDPGEMSGKRRRGRPETSYSSNITKWMSESMERITRDTRTGSRWMERRLVRGAARAADQIITSDRSAKEVHNALVLLFGLLPVLPQFYFYIIHLYIIPI